jgi:hypothetical protein
VREDEEKEDFLKRPVIRIDSAHFFTLPFSLSHHHHKQAVLRGREDVVKLLLEHGVDQTLVDSTKSTACMLAERPGLEAIRELFD